MVGVFIKVVGEAIMPHNKLPTLKKKKIVRFDTLLIRSKFNHPSSLATEALPYYYYNLKWIDGL